MILLPRIRGEKINEIMMYTAKNQETKQMAHSAEHEASPQIDDTSNRPGKLGTKRQMQGAAVAGGVTGIILVGPAAGLLAAGGAALVTSSRGEIGKAARSTGDSVSDLGKSLKKFEKKHNVKEKTSRGIVKGCDWVSKRLSKETGSKMIT